MQVGELDIVGVVVAGVVDETVDWVESHSGTLAGSNLNKYIFPGFLSDKMCISFINLI